MFWEQGCISCLVLIIIVGHFALGKEITERNNSQDKILVTVLRAMETSWDQK